MYRLLTFLLATSVFIGCGKKPTTPDTTLTTPSSSATVAPTAASDDSNASVDANATVELPTEQNDFGNKWKAASVEERRTMADLAKVHPLFQGATKTQIKNALGQAAKTGIDRFGDDVMRYELGDVPEADGGGKYHLTFVFENNAVVRVMGNFVSISP